MEGANVLAGSFLAAGVSPPKAFVGSFNISLWGDGAGAVVTLQRSFDGGATWLPVSQNQAGDPLQWTGAFSGTWTEIENSVVYRLVCSEIASGQVYYRLSNSNSAMWVAPGYRT